MGRAQSWQIWSEISPSCRLLSNLAWSCQDMPNHAKSRQISVNIPKYFRPMLAFVESSQIWPRPDKCCRILAHLSNSFSNLAQRGQLFPNVAKSGQLMPDLVEIL